MNKLNQYRLRFGFKRFQWFKLSKVKDGLNGKQLLDFLYSPDGDLIAPWQYLEEIGPLISIYEKLKPKTVLEIGTANGGTLFLYSKLATEDALIISIDLPGGKFGGGYPDWKTPLYRKFARPKQHLELVRANSHDDATFEKTKKLLNGRPVDFLFIDADHTYEGIKKDFLTYSELVAPKGVIAFHDVANHPNPVYGVHKFWQEIKNNYKHEEFIRDPKQHGLGIGVIYK
jgi:predicted O-methyltransferase YrrM